MTFIGAKALLEMQHGDPRKLIRGVRKVLLFPWRPLEPGEAGRALFVVTSSDLLHWNQDDVELLRSFENRALVRLQRPGSLSQNDVLALRGAESIFLDVWAGDEAVRRQLLEVLLQNMQPINDYRM